MRISRKFITVVAVGLAGLGLGTAPAHAEPETPYAPTMIILDASGSMRRPDPAGTMMDAARNAVRTFVDSAPATARVGLATYGTGTGNDEAEKAAGCRDVRILRQADTLDRAALTDAVNGIEARGWTPMGTALREAAAALPADEPRSIVLVSDGEDTCAPPDPCDVARELKQQGVDLTVHTIGFAVDDAARTQLTCMAEATGGSYSDAADGAALERMLPKVTTAALRDYQAAGTPITGTADYADAPVARPGHHLDTLGQHEKRFYAVDVPQGATAYFSGIMSYPRVSDVSIVDDYNTLETRVYGHDGTDCREREREQAGRSSDGVTLTVSETWRGAAEEGRDATDQCAGAGRYYFSVEWDNVSEGVPARLPLEILVGIEPAAIDPGPVAVLPATTFVPPTTAAQPVTGGGSFNSATTLDGSGRYSDILRPGEYVFYRVRLNWGQGLAYRVNFEANDARGLSAISNITTTLYSPLAEEIDSDSHVYTGSAGMLPTGDSAIATVPIRYNNRAADQADVREQSVAGWYYIAVKLGSAAADGQTPVPVHLDLTVAGTAESGPTYADDTGNGVLGEGKAPVTSAPTATGAEAEPRRGLVLAAVGGVGAAVILGGALLIALRRRRG
ncbi:vWA domain-containing protein [Nocardia otitidiscaviarum]|uniref:vWA domain-containing protein n=1 Tax=Nocardia otitidiscaviarum TaxID=1823 RepID=UPI00245703B6|nr:VWA domain-containing protein [Nocardia otitidiscaviarum]